VALSPTASALLTLEPTVNNDARLATRQAIVTGMLEDIIPSSCKDYKFVALTELQLDYSAARSLPLPFPTLTLYSALSRQFRDIVWRFLYPCEGRFPDSQQRQGSGSQTQSIARLASIESLTDAFEV
jgi:hypothetical protein